MAGCTPNGVVWAWRGVAGHGWCRVWRGVGSQVAVAGRVSVGVVCLVTGVCVAVVGGGVGRGAGWTGRAGCGWVSIGGW